MRRRRRHYTSVAGAVTLIIGAGDAGRAVVRRLRDEPGGLSPAGFVDDGLPGEVVCGLPVLGGTDDIGSAARRVGARTAIVATPSLPPAGIARLVARATEAGLDVRYVSPSGTEPRRVLHRDELDVLGGLARLAIAGRRVLITGACGTVGAPLARLVRGLGPAALLQVDTDGPALRRLAAESPVGLAEVADVRDPARVAGLIDGLRPDVVFHAAGYTGEESPGDAVLTNVLGTRNLARAAVRRGVECLVLVSTDRAADPVSVFGATRRLAELVVQAEAGGATRLASVRVGTVLSSGSSPFTTLAGQIADGEAITVAHPDLTRHLMTAREAAELVVEAAALAREAETFALDTGPAASVLDLAGRFVDGLCVPDVRIRFTGLGPGERLGAAPFSVSEAQVPTAHPKIYATRATPRPPGREELFTALFAAASNAVENDVRLLMRRIIPEYQPNMD